MTEKKVAPKSILEDIFDEMFNIIEEKDIFSKEAIKNLKELADKENFKEEKSIIEIIESEEGEIE